MTALFLFIGLAILEAVVANGSQKACTPNNIPSLRKKGFCSSIDNLAELCAAKRLEMSSSKDCLEFDGSWCCYNSTVLEKKPDLKKKPEILKATTRFPMLESNLTSTPASSTVVDTTSKSANFVSDKNLRATTAKLIQAVATSLDTKVASVMSTAVSPTTALGIPKAATITSGTNQNSASAVSNVTTTLITTKESIVGIASPSAAPVKVLLASQSSFLAPAPAPYNLQPIYLPAPAPNNLQPVYLPPAPATYLTPAPSPYNLQPIYLPAQATNNLQPIYLSAPTPYIPQSSYSVSPPATNNLQPIYLPPAPATYNSQPSYPATNSLQPIYLPPAPAAYNSQPSYPTTTPSYNTSTAATQRPCTAADIIQLSNLGLCVTQGGYLLCVPNNVCSPF